MKISVVTVCFNSAMYIADALQSADRQTWRDREHLVIDGGSRDETLRIVESHAKPWRRVVSESDHGIYDAMNKGIRLAEGDVIGLLNSDDLYASDKVLETIAAVFTDPQVDACYGDLCYVRRDVPSAVVRYWRSSPFRPGVFATGWAPPHPTLFVRRHVYQRFGGFDLRHGTAADFELMLRLIEVQRIRTRHVPKVLVKMRTGGATGWPNVMRQNVEIWRALAAHGQQPSIARFVSGKLWSRGRQFLARPT